MIDTHLHLVNENYEDIDKVILDAKKEGVLYLIHGGSCKKDNTDSLELSKKYDNVFVTLGYHPSEVDKVSDEDMNFLEQQIILNMGKVVGIGEIGLDYHYGKEDKVLQIELFEKQLKLAEKYNLPVVIHTRDSIMETYEILSKYSVKGVIHCFSGSLEMARKFIDLGFLLGIGGVVTFSNSKLCDVVLDIGIENIVLETDSPYLSPLRGTRNEPKNIKLIASFLASYVGLDILEVAKITTSNAVRLFDLNIDI